MKSLSEILKDLAGELNEVFARKERWSGKTAAEIVTKHTISSDRLHGDQLVMEPTEFRKGGENALTEQKVKSDEEEKAFLDTITARINKAGVFAERDWTYPDGVVSSKETVTQTIYEMIDRYSDLTKEREKVVEILKAVGIEDESIVVCIVKLIRGNTGFLS